MTQPIPFTGGLQPRVIAAGLFASTVRNFIETPLEFVKIRAQTNQPWRLHATWGESLRNPMLELGHAYQGFVVSWFRTAGLMTPFFIMTEYVRHRRACVAGQVALHHAVSPHFHLAAYTAT